MKKLFIVLAKLLGLLQVFWALAHASSLGLLLLTLRNWDDNPISTIWIHLLGIAFAVVVYFLFAWVLLFRAEWIAQKLRIPDDPVPALPAPEALLPICVKLLGIYALVSGIPALLRNVAQASSAGMWDGSLRTVWTGVVPSVLKVALGLFMALRTESLLTIVRRGEKIQTKRLVIGCVVLLAALIGLSRAMPTRIQSRFHSRYFEDSHRTTYAGPAVPSRSAPWPQGVTNSGTFLYPYGAHASPDTSKATFYSVPPPDTNVPPSPKAYSHVNALHIEFEGD